MTKMGARARTGALATVAVAAVAVAWCLSATAQTANCARTEFEAVVDDAAGSLRELNQTNKPSFQEKLRLLRDKRAWNHEQFLKEAAPLVQDDRIAEFDQRSADLLAKITSMGQEGADAKAPDCKLLAELRGHMKSLVEAQQAKWSYMFGKIDGELAK